ncbi:TPA: hypothetical protein ACIRGN_000891 [Streptococcus suis]|nr:hypothetical protein [Streptococcus suis]
MTILEKIKEMVELDIDETIFDVQLLSYINSGISYLNRNGIPVVKIDDDSEDVVWESIAGEDVEIIIDWLHLRCVQRFDKSLMNGSETTMKWIDSEMTNLLYQLKAVYATEP